MHRFTTLQYYNSKTHFYIIFLLKQPSFLRQHLLYPNKLTKGKKRGNQDVKLHIDNKEVIIPPDFFAFIKMLINSRQVADKISPADAADILCIPVEYVFKLVEKEKIKVKKEGEEIYFSKKEVVTYKEEQDAMREEGLRELTRIGQELNLP